MSYNGFKIIPAYATLVLLAASAFISCESHNFDGDKRQIMAKDEIRHKLHNVRDFDVTGFYEDTLQNPVDSNFKKMIRYSLDVTYKDSNQVTQEKKAIVLFTPDGQSIIRSEIVEK